MADPREEHIYLYSCKDGSDKDYNLHLIPDTANPDLWRLNYENGKHDAALKAKPKIEGAVPYEVAKKEFDKTVREKLTKGGYTPQGSGIAYQDVVPAERKSGIEPQLLEAIPVEDVMARLDDPNYVWQEKMDGERRPIRKTTGGGAVTVIGTQREGLIIPLPTNLEQAVAALPIDSCILDGEDLGQGRYAAFDLISCPEDPHGRRPYVARWAALQTLLRAAPSDCWVAIPTANSPEEARALLATVRARNGEGIVGKRRDAAYSPGSNSRDQFKYPFRDRVTCFVERHDLTKRSVHIAVYDDAGAVMPLKKVTIPANFAIPAIGAVVDVEYAHAHRSGGLARPVFKGVRGDRRLEHCVASQLKYKAEESYAGLDEQQDDWDELEEAETPACR